MRDESRRRGGGSGARERLEWADWAEGDPAVCLCACSREDETHICKMKRVRWDIRAKQQLNRHGRSRTRAHGQMLL